MRGTKGTDNSTKKLVDYLKSLDSAEKEEALKILGDGGSPAIDWVVKNWTAISPDIKSADRDTIAYVITTARNSFTEEYKTLYQK